MTIEKADCNTEGSASSEETSSTGVAGSPDLTAGQWETIFDSIVDMVSIQDVNFRIIKTNKAFTDTLGVTAEEVLGKKCYEVIHHAQCPWPDCPHGQVMRAGKAATEEFLEPRLGRFLRVSASPIRNEAGELTGSVHIVKDITGHKALEERAVGGQEIIQAMAEALPVSISYIDRDRICRYINAQCETWWGRSAGEVVGRGVPEILGEERYRKIAASIDAVLAGKAVRYENQSEKKDGMVHTFRVQYLPHVKKNGEVAGFFTVMEDISDLKRAEDVLRKGRDYLEMKVSERTLELKESLLDLSKHQLKIQMQNDELLRSQAELEESRALYSDLYDNAPVGYFSFDPEGMILRLNLAGAAMLGFERALLMGKPFGLFVVPGYRAVFNEHCREVLSEGRRKRCELGLVRNDGALLYATVETVCVSDCEGSHPRLRSVITDITERKRTEEALEESLVQARKREEEIEAMAGSSHAALIRRDFKDAAPAILESCRKAVGALAGYLVLPGGEVFLSASPESAEITFPSRPVWREHFGTLAGQMEGPAYDNSFPGSRSARIPAEEYKGVESLLSLPLAVEGRIYGLLGLANKPGGFTDHDVQLGKGFAEIATMALMNSQARWEVERSEERYRSLVTATAQVVWNTNASGEVVEDMPLWRAFTGQSEDQIKGWGWIDALHPEDRARTAELWSVAVRTRTVYDTEYRLWRRDGMYRHVSARGAPVREADGSIREWVGTCTDITERKWAEEKLKESEQRFRLLFEHHQAVMLLVDPDSGEIIDGNEAAARYYGYPRDRFHAMVITDINQLEPEELATELGEAKREQRNYFIFPHRLASGEIRTVEVHSSPIEIQGRLLLFSIVHDITERRWAEEKLKESELALRVSQRDLRKLTGRLLSAEEEERSRVARELHDDFTQRLAVLAIDAGKLQQRLAATCPEAVPVVEKLQDQLVRLSTDVHHLSRQLHPSILDDLGLVKAIESESRRFSQQEGIEVKFETRDVELPVPKEIGISLYRVIQEALRNVAKHARSKDVLITLTGGRNQLRLIVKDYGVGFDTFKAKDRAGMGLASIRERVRLLEGHLTIQSQPGHGVSIAVKVPLKRRQE